MSDSSWSYFPEFYTKLLTADHGSEVKNVRGCRPRGTFTKGEPGKLDLMLVLQNPGDPVPDVEWNLESDNPSASCLSQRLWQFSGDVWAGKYYSRTYAVAKKEAADLLGCSEAHTIERLIYTNAIRSSLVSTQPFSPKLLATAGSWLAEEIALWQPKNVIAYGNIAAKALRSAGIESFIDLPHPSARGIWLNAEIRRKRLDIVQQRLC